ncbi:MAG: transposase [Deltaproteobacteria bacterium]|jgi:REP element-mobilizing transposase RayT|nr:transposase [Deltaproteobacteria bacterium]
MHKNKHYVQGTCLFITSRVEQDLPFTTCKLINTAIWGILARASTLWDISVCHFLFMSNHFHLIAVVRDPSHVPMFIKQIKQETAAAINRLTGRRQHTIWCKGFSHGAGLLCLYFVY